MMRIVHVVAGIWEHTGGPAEVIPRLCQNLVKQGCRITLLTLDGPHSQATIDCSNNGVELLSFPVIGRGGIWFSPKLSKALKQLASECDIIHNHGMWLYPNWAASKWARAFGKPLVISPHGVLTPGMLQRSRLKKYIAWNLFDKRSIEYASVIQAFTSEEYKSMKLKIEKKQVAVIPNGVDVHRLPESHCFFDKYPKLKKKKILLFLARIHPIKGVYDLIDVWSRLSSKYPDWQLVMVGNKEADCVINLDNMVIEKGLQNRVTFTGALYGNDKYEALAAADAFILPSYAEGFPTSILEAMSYGLPIVYTEPCNFSEVENAGAGFKSETGADNIINNIKKALDLSDSERKTMGDKGKKLIEESYNWDYVASHWLDVYRWLSEKNNNKPKYVLD